MDKVIVTIIDNEFMFKERSFKEHISFEIPSNMCTGFNVYTEPTTHFWMPVNCVVDGYASFAFFMR